MILRKHLSGGKILSFDFHDFERIITINFECITELGDTVIKKLIVEIMGKHSNIILTNEQDIIIDAIRHIDSDISRVREVMPARHYVLPPKQDKISPFEIDPSHFFTDDSANLVKTDTSMPLDKYLLSKIRGFSPLLCREICFRADVDSKIIIDTMTLRHIESVKSSFIELVDEIRTGKFSPCVIFNSFNQEIPQDFHCLNIKNVGKVQKYDSISEAMDVFYLERDRAERNMQKKSNLTKALSNRIDRCYKKLAIREETIRSVEDRDNLRLYGELITANIFNIKKGIDCVKLQNYYSPDGEYISIPLEVNLSPQDNAQKYFKKYNKAKSAFVQTNKQIVENHQEIKYLESVVHMLDSAETVQEIDDIRQELIEEGYIKAGAKDKKGKRRIKNQKENSPAMFKSSDGFTIYAGKNNKQNDILTLKTASSSDIWLHTKNIPGSHVIIRGEGREISETAILEAAIIAARHSKARTSSNVNVDYTKVKYVKKPAGAKPGMVIYTHYRTLTVTP